LNAYHDCKEARLRDRDVLVQLGAGLPERDADRLCLDDGAKLAFNRLDRVIDDDAETFQDREPGLSRLAQ
jgi:hypothetical protein